MKFPKLAAPLAALALICAEAAADPRLDCKTRSDAANVLTDVIVVRPVGAAGTLAGAALFVGLSPLTALAAIPEPHDAFNKLGGILVGVPYAYTFVRPLGYFSNTCN